MRLLIALALFAVALAAAEVQPVVLPSPAQPFVDTNVNAQETAPAVEADVTPVKVVDSPLDITKEAALLDDAEVSPVIVVGSPLDITKESALLDDAEVSPVIVVDSPLDITKEAALLDDAEVSPVIVVDSPLDITKEAALLDDAEVSPVIVVDSPLDITKESALLDDAEVSPVIVVDSPLDITKESALLYDAEVSPVIVVDSPLDLTKEAAHLDDDAEVSPVMVVDSPLDDAAKEYAPTAEDNLTPVQVAVPDQLADISPMFIFDVTQQNEIPVENVSPVKVVDLAENVEQEAAPWLQRQEAESVKVVDIPVDAEGPSKDIPILPVPKEMWRGIPPVPLYHKPLYFRGMPVLRDLPDPALR